MQGEIIPFVMLDPPPVLMTSEPDPAWPDQWRLDAYFEQKPDADIIAGLCALVPSAAGITPIIERIEEQDWVTLSQQGLEPVRAGRFFVHTPAHRERIPADAVALEIDAGRAFGTGRHETTTGCLMALDRLRQDGAVFNNILDLGTGTGLLAFSSLKLWPVARVMASDIDSVAIDVASSNAVINHIPLGRSRGHIELAVADGLAHPRLTARAPYDLIIANILAGPLIELAPAVTDALEGGGRLILAGLLETQEDKVAAAYRREGMTAGFSIVQGEWPTLVMRKRRSALRR